MALNQHDLWTVSIYALLLIYTNDPQGALEKMETVEPYEPFPPNWHWENWGIAHYDLRCYDEAVAACHRMTALKDWNHAMLAACYGQLGKTAEAKAHWAKIREPNTETHTTFWEPFRTWTQLAPNIGWKACERRDSQND